MQTEDFEMLMENYKKAAGSNRGALFFAVMNGKLSEGYDFSS